VRLTRSSGGDLLPLPVGAAAAASLPAQGAAPHVARAPCPAAHRPPPHSCSGGGPATPIPLCVGRRNTSGPHRLRRWAPIRGADRRYPRRPKRCV